MAAYLPSEEFLDQSIPAGAIDGLDDVTIDRALDWASRLADSYLRKRYELPLVSWSDDLKTCVGDLAAFRLLSHRGFRPGSGNNEIIVRRYDDAIAWLKDISRGICELVDAVDQTTDTDEAGPIMTTPESPTFRFNTGNRNNGGCGC